MRQSTSLWQKIHKKTKLKTYDNEVNAAFSDNKIPKEKIHYSCIVAIFIDSVSKLIIENYS